MHSSIRFLSILAVTLLIGNTQHLLAQDSLGIVKVGELRFDWDTAIDVAISGQYAYVADGDAGLRIVDISNPNHPTETGYFRTPGEATDVAVFGNHAYIGGRQITEPLPNANGGTSRRGGFYTVDISDPTNPQFVSLWDSTTYFVGLVAVENYVMTLRDNDNVNLNHIYVVDVTDPVHPNYAADYQLSDDPLCYQLIGNDLYVGHDRGFDVVSLLDPLNISTSANYRGNDYLKGICAQGSIVFGLSSNSDLITYTLAVEQVNLLSRISLDADNRNANAISLGDGFVVVSTRRNQSGGYPRLNENLLFDITEPDNVELISQIATEYPLGKGVILDGIGYFVGELGGLISLNLTNPEEPAQIGSCSKPSNISDIAVVDGIACIAHGEAGWSTVNIQTADSPVWQGMVSASKVSSVNFADGLLYTGGDALASYELTDSVGPRLKMNWVDSQGWNITKLSYSSDYLLVSENNSLNFVNIQVPERPAIVGWINSKLTPVQDGDLLLSTGSSTLTVWDIAAPSRATVLSSYSAQWKGNGLALQDSLAFVVCSREGSTEGALMIISYRDPYRLEEFGYLALPSAGKGIVLQDNFAYVADGEAGLVIVNIGNPANPEICGYYDTPGNALKVIMDGETAYVADSTYFGIYDCSGATRRMIRRLGPLTPPEQQISTYPNPFNSATTISFSLPVAGRIALKAYDSRGRVILNLTPVASLPAGNHNLRWDAAALPSGRYFLRLEGDGWSSEQPVSIVR